MTTRLDPADHDAEKVYRLLTGLVVPRPIAWVTSLSSTGILNLANRLYGGAVTTTEGACRMIAGETVESWMVEGSVPLRYTYENAASFYDAL